jgi:hypothetical protein
MRKVHIQMVEAFKAGKCKAKTARNAATGASGHIYRVESEPGGVSRLFYWGRVIATYDREAQTLKVTNGGYIPRGHGRCRSPNEDGSTTTKAILNALLGELGIPWRIEAHKLAWRAVNYRTGQVRHEWAGAGLWFNVDTGNASGGIGGTNARYDVTA